MIPTTTICFTLFFLMFSMNVRVCVSQYNKPWTDKYENNKCPKLYPKNFLNYMPVGKLLLCFFFITFIQS